MELIFPDIFNLLKNLHILVYLGLLVLFSYAGGEVASFLKTPRVTGYIVTGILFGPSVIGLFHERLVKEELDLVTHIALGIIAFSIGGSLELKKIKALGKQIAWVNFAEAFGAFLVVTVSLALLFPLISETGSASGSFWSSYFPVALLIGAISSATAPAAVLAIVHEYRAKGPLTTILLGVVALDDAIAIFLFAFASSVAGSLVGHHGISWQNFLLAPLSSILISLCIGGVLGLCIRKFIFLVPRREAMLGVIVGLIFLTSGLAIALRASPLLANMMLGFMVVNFVAHHQDLFQVVEGIEEPIFGIFFILAGAHLDLRVIETAGWLALFIILGRSCGKLLGVRLGARISEAPETVRKYLGLALLPQAGVAVGLLLEAKGILAQTPLLEIAVSGVLGSVVINELLCPYFTKFALTKAGEVSQKSDLK
ncbi:MAG: cation:proton antiporter [Deltaproteobacteria bacterium]|nr:cation:proton antiporter [Deltaproteobacteria bacterium]